MQSVTWFAPQTPFNAVGAVELDLTEPPSSTMSAELPTDPKAVKKIEKVIAKEAGADEKDYKHALKELRRTEKSDAKASKVSRFGSHQGWIHC